MPDRLTGRTDDEIRSLFAQPTVSLTFNEFLALAGYALSEKTDGVTPTMLPLTLIADDPAATERRRDLLRDLALAHTALEDALTRYNSACYRRAGTWKRADPDRA